jgi:diguanylate cyclase
MAYLDGLSGTADLRDAEGRLLRTLGDLVATMTPVGVTPPPTGGEPPTPRNGSDQPGAVLPGGITLADAVARLLAGPHGGGEQITIVGADGNSAAYSAWELFATLAGALAHSTMHDPLTGLPTRQWLLEEIDRRISGASAAAPFGLLQVELGQLKDINDSLGYELGDALIVAAAERMKATLRSGDLISRLVGDEFAVVSGLPPDASASGVLDLAHRLLGVLGEPVRLGEHELMLQASVGVCVVDGPAENAEAVLRRADSAMHRAKFLGRGRAELYDPATDRPVDRLSRTQRLREGISKGQMYLHWQPIHRLADGALVGAEALIRWRDSTGRQVSPEEFIPYAETVGLIMPIGSMVLNEAAAQAARWQRLGLALPVSVNVSAQQVVGSDLVGEVRGALERYGVPASSLRLELTETAAVTDYTVTARRLAELRALGVSLSLDDFGTGYSSLRLLRDLAVDDVKVDRSFVAGIDANDADVAMVRLVVETSHALGLTVTAEGVERVTQLEALARLNCDHVQGFLLGRPVPVADFDTHGSVAAAQALSAPTVARAAHA